jgi:predicted transcriptional regulator
MKVKECISKPMRTVRAEQTVQEAAAAMRQFDVAELAVKKDDAIQGFLTDRDIITCCAAEGADPTVATVEQFMRQDVARCREDQDIEEAATIMGKNGTRHLLVVNAQDRIIGILSPLNLARQRAARESVRQILGALCGS